MEILILTYLFILGLSIGSFVLVVVDRTHAKQDWIHGRSRCSSCKKTLQARDLVPLVSWLISRGRCRYCHVSLSPAYPLVEFFVGCAFVVSYLLWPFELNEILGTISLVLWLVSLVPASVLFLYDARWYALPSGALYSYIGIGVIYRAILIATNDKSIMTDITSLAITLAVSAGLFGLLHSFSKGEWIGDGDIFLAIAMGLFLQGPVEIWIAICIASLSGIILALPKLLRSRKNLKMKVPFGPLLLVGLFVAFFFATPLIRWYTDAFLYL